MKRNWRYISCTGKEILSIMGISSIVVLLTGLIARFNIIPSFNNNDTLQRTYVLLITLTNFFTTFTFIMTAIIFIIGSYINATYKKKNLQAFSTLFDIFVDTNSDE